MDSAIGSEGVFIMFGIFCFLGALFNYYFVAETKGLTEIQRKSLYIPGAKYGRKLRPEEKGTRYMRLSIRERSVSVASFVDRKNSRQMTLKKSSNRLMHQSSYVEVDNYVRNKSIPRIRITPQASAVIL